ncbi:hypothetical protein SH501x_002683 [Pirellulaceae bacterium SH501]
MEHAPNRTNSRLETLGIVTTPWGGAGKKWILPARDLGKWRHLGWLALVPCLFLLPFVFGLFRFLNAFGLPLFGNPNGNGNANPGIADWIPLLIAIPFILVFLGIFWQFLKFASIGFGVVRQTTRTEIELDEKGVICREVIGWAKFKRRVKDRESLMSLAVITGEEWAKLRRRSPSQARSVVVPLPENLRYMLVAKRPGTDLFVIAVGYSAEILGAVAKDLGEALRLAPDAVIESGVIGNALQASDVAHGNDTAWTTLAANTVPTQPEGSKVSIERREDGITFHVPSQGLWNGSKGLFFFAILWTGFSTVMMVIFTLAMTGVLPGKVEGSPLIAVLVMGFFEAIGIAMLLGAIHMGTRTSTLATSYGMLFISSTSIFGKKTKQWDREGIERIELAPSGMSVNDRPVMQLSVIDKSAKTFGCLTQLNDAEIEWIAYELNQSLELIPAIEGTVPPLLS